MRRAPPPTSRALECAHQEMPEGLAQRMLADERLKLGDDIGGRPSSMSTSIRSSIATSRSSFSRRVSDCAHSSYANSASAVPSPELERASKEAAALGPRRAWRRRGAARSGERRPARGRLQDVSGSPGDEGIRAESFRSATIEFWSDVVAVFGGSWP